jgi:hypothetical protein
MSFISLRCSILRHRIFLEKQNPGKQGLRKPSRQQGRPETEARLVSKAKQTESLVYQLGDLLLPT